MLFCVWVIPLFLLSVFIIFVNFGLVLLPPLSLWTFCRQGACFTQLSTVASLAVGQCRRCDRNSVPICWTNHSSADGMSGTESRRPVYGKDNCLWFPGASVKPPAMYHSPLVHIWHLAHVTIPQLLFFCLEAKEISRDICWHIPEASSSKNQSGWKADKAEVHLRKTEQENWQFHVGERCPLVWAIELCTHSQWSFTSIVLCFLLPHLFRWLLVVLNSKNPLTSVRPTSHWCPSKIN